MSRKVRATLKSALVDADILPWVEWLNRFSNCYTIYFARGTSDPKRILIPGVHKMEMPYVVFICLDTLVLARIMEAVKDVAWVSVDWESGVVRYKLNFKNLLEGCGKPPRV